MNDNFLLGFETTLGHALSLAKKTPWRLWNRLPAKINSRVEVLTMMTQNSDHAKGLLAGRNYAVACVQRWYGRRACWELEVAMSLF